MKIAIVDDDPSIAELVSIWLSDAGYSCSNFSSGHDFMKAVNTEQYDLLLLDWVMPEFDGEQVLEWIRNQPDLDMPVIFVTARDTEDDISKILTQGADDYIVKPVKQKELVARIKAVTRRSIPHNDHQEMVFGNLCIDPVSRIVSKVGEPVKLTEKEFKLILFIFKNIGRLLSREQILSAVWGYDEGINTRTVDTHMSRIRKKLDLAPENGWRLSSIYHQGYRLERLETD
ncbi:MAG: response regulator transcription factor [Gammaproteobacteria bacterium]